jgi:hypothetical protein
MAEKTEKTPNINLLSKTTLRNLLKEQVEAISNAPQAENASAAAINARAITSIIKALEALKSLDARTPAKQKDTDMSEDQRERKERLRAALEQRLAALLGAGETKAVSGQPDGGRDAGAAGDVDPVGPSGAEGTSGA